MSRILTVGMISGGLVAITGTAAFAACAYTQAASSNITDAFTGGTWGNCNQVQARIDRYYGGSVHSIYGAYSNSHSSASDSNGTNSGNYTRAQEYNGGPWGGWQRI
ncbi:hypothetical protein [Dactylosporangium sp. NPDC051541]|uniref:hypothetical protein n=1 Tax=Dactylosporangium sp. NPDC051541 TaxID=3363977 RepID=UPI0037AF412B